jgi:hypothetical protein
MRFLATLWFYSRVGIALILLGLIAIGYMVEETSGIHDRWEDW